MSITARNKVMNTSTDNKQVWFLVTLILLLFIPIFNTIFSGHLGLILAISYTLLIFCGVRSFWDSKRHFTTTIVLGSISFLFTWKAFFGGHTAILEGAKTISLLAFFSYLAYRVFNKILLHKAVDINIIYLSISGYLIIGIIGGLVFQALELAIPHSFNTLIETYNAYDLQYFSFVTLSSLGFGDITPKSEAAKSLTIMLTVCGQLYLTILVAILVGKFLNTNKARSVSQSQL